MIDSNSIDDLEVRIDFSQQNYVLKNKLQSISGVGEEEKINLHLCESQVFECPQIQEIDEEK